MLRYYFYVCECVHASEQLLMWKVGVVCQIQIPVKVVAFNFTLEKVINPSVFLPAWQTGISQFSWSKREKFWIQNQLIMEWASPPHKNLLVTETKPHICEQQRHIWLVGAQISGMDRGVSRNSHFSWSLQSIINLNTWIASGLVPNKLWYAYDIQGKIYIFF